MVAPRLATTLVLAAGLLSGPAWAKSTVDYLEGIAELRGAVETALDDPEGLEKRRFVLNYTGPLNRGEQLGLRIEPAAAFGLRRLDARSFEVRVERANVLTEQDFLREITVLASRQSAASLMGSGRGSCVLGVRFLSDVGHPVELDTYPQVDVEWWPKEAATLLDRAGGHILFQRNKGYELTAVDVRAILRLGDGSSRTTSPAHLGYCTRPLGPRAGFTLAGGTSWRADAEVSGELGMPLEFRFGQAHLRLSPVLIFKGEQFGIVGQVAIGHRTSSDFGLRVGGEAGFLDGARVAGFLEGTYTLEKKNYWELGVRIRAGSQVSAGFGEVLLTVSVLPLHL